MKRQHYISEDNYHDLKGQIISNLAPIDQVPLSFLKVERNNIINLGGDYLPCSPLFLAQLGKVLGAAPAQMSYLLKSSSENLADAFNHLISLQSTVEKPEVVLSIDPDTNHLDSIRKIRHQMIPPEAFFLVTEEVLNGHEFDIVNLENNSQSIQINLMKKNSSSVAFRTGEEFLTEGIYLNWNPTMIEAGHYYERVLCINGATIRDVDCDYRLKSITDNNLKKLIKGVSSNNFFKSGVGQYLELAQEAYKSRASLRELKFAKNALCQIGIDSEKAEELFPYKHSVDLYQEAGIYEKGKDKYFKARETIWDTYNKLTEFSSHTDLLDRDSLDRQHVRDVAQQLLTQKRDIITYEDLFEKQH